MQPDDDPDRLERLQAPDDAGDGAQDARLLAARCSLRGRGRAREEAAVAGPVRPQIVRAQLAVEPLRGAAHQRLAEEHGRVGEQVPRRGVVGAVEDHVVVGPPQERARVCRRERVGDRVYVEARVGPADAAPMAVVVSELRTRERERERAKRIYGVLRHGTV